MHQLLIIIAFVAAAVGLLAVGVIFRKDHSFRSQHIHENPKMRENNIHCSTAQDRELRRKNKHSIQVKDL